MSATDSTRRAIEFILEAVEKPAMAHLALEQGFKNKVANAVRLLKQFKKIGDLFLYMDRFSEGQQAGALYERFHALGLKTFEDILPELERKFGAYRYDVTNLDDFVIGRDYTSWDIAIFSRVYNVQKGIYLIGPDEARIAIFIKATFGGEGRYANQWLEDGQKVKYYAKAVSGRFSLSYKENDAITHAVDLPIYVFQKTGTVCYLAGIFRHMDHVQEDDGSIWFQLERRGTFSHKQPTTDSEYRRELEKAVGRSRSGDHAARKRRLRNAPKLPEAMVTATTTYRRNPDVIAEVLDRARGVCEECGKPAPFRRGSDGTPYLEVHHLVQLAHSGEDTVENAVAICPNCHRRFHYG